MAKKKKKPESTPASEPEKGEPSPRARALRLAALLVGAAAIGTGGGAIAVEKLNLREALPGARAANALTSGDAEALLAAAGTERGTPEQIAQGALADALLMVDFGGGEDSLERLQAFQKADDAVQRTPEGLYARALFTRTGAIDKTLDDDIAELGANDKGDDAPPEHPALRLARAARLVDAKRVDDAWIDAQGAALEPGAPAYALVAASRLALARGEMRAAGALAERGLARAPTNGMLVALRVLASALEQADGAVTEEDTEGAKAGQKSKARRGDKSAKDDDKDDDREGDKGDDPPAPDKPARVREANAIETRMAKELDRLSPRDAAVAAWALQAVALARGDAKQAEAHAKVVLAAVPDSAALAARQAELHLLAGDVAAAEELIGAALKRSAGDADLLLARARVRALNELPPEARRRSNLPAHTEANSLALPLGRLVVDAKGGLPLRTALDPTLAPDDRLVAARAAGGPEVEARLGVIEQVWKAEHALLRGDVPTAAEAAAAARSKAPDDVDVLLVDAKARLLQGDREGVKAALRAAVESAGDNPAVLLAVSRIAYDAEDFPSARTWLRLLQAAGVRSPSAAAMSAMLFSREGDAKGAQAALKEAEAISADDVDVLRARLVIARNAADLGEVRKLADRLLRIDDARSPDPLLRAWQGEALFRKGDSERAQAVLQSVLAARPRLIDAHLAMGIATASERPLEAAASFAQVIQIGGDAALVAEASRRRTAIKDAPPLSTPPKGK